jgi:hypothetical protein
MFDQILATMNYVTNASFFYPSMGLTAGTAIWIGAAIYNGDVKTMYKGVITLGAYVVLLLTTTFPRISQAIGTGAVPVNMTNYAGPVTIFFVTLYYLLGMIIGVYTVQRVHKHHGDTHMKTA